MTRAAFVLLAACALVLAAGAGVEASPRQDPPAAARPTARALAPGERAEIHIESTLELDIHTQEGGDNPAAKQLAIFRSETYEQEALQDGRLRVTCRAAKLQESGTGRAPKAESLAIEGQAFLVTRTEGGRKVETAAGEPADSGAAAVGGWEEWVRLLPDGDVRAGGRWTLEAVDWSALISVPHMPKATGRFEATLEQSDANTITILFSGMLEGKSPAGYTSKLEITEGRFVFDVAKGRPTSCSVSGKLEASKDVTRKVYKPNELTVEEERVGSVQVTSRTLNVKVEFK